VIIVGANAAATARDYFTVWANQPAIDQVFQADLLHSLGLLDRVPPGATVLATTDVYEGVPIPSAFVPAAQRRIRAFDGQKVFVAPSGQSVSTYYIYARSDEPTNDSSLLLERSTRLATSSDRFGRIDGELFRLDPPNAIRVPDREASALISTAVRVTGVDLPTVVRPGDTIRYGLHWTVGGTLPPGQWEFFAHLVDREGSRLLASDYNHGFPPGQWRDGDRVISWFDLQIPDSATPTVADLNFGLFDTQTGQRLPVTTIAGEPVGSALVVGPVRVAGPTFAAPPPQHPLQARFGSGMALEGYDVVKNATDDPIIRLHWRSNQLVTKDYTVFVHLLDSSGKLLVGADSQPAAGESPTSTWQPGEVTIDDHTIAGGGQSNAATLEVGVYLLSTGERLPAFDIATEHPIGDAVRLPW
jgi:hypothetical protein